MSAFIKKSLFWGLICFCIASLRIGGALAADQTATAPAANEEVRVNFRWAFGAMTGGEGERKFESVTREAVLKTGDRLKMMVELQKQCHVYVIHRNSHDELAMLFPYNGGQAVGDPLLGKPYFIPEGDAWFELDQNVGKETFYLLASPDRLTGLEDLFAAYQAADAERKQEIARRIQAEILNMRKQHRELASAAERPLSIGGAIRGMETGQGGARADLGSIADQVISSGAVARTFTIDHR